MTTNHPANGPVSIDRLHQIREILSKASAQSDGGNLGYAMADAVKVINGAIAAFDEKPVAWRYRYVHTPKTEEHGSPFTTEWKLCDSEDECNPSDCFERQPLYTAPPAPVVPETLPCPVHLEPGLKFGKGVRTRCLMDALRRRADYYAELEAMTPEQRAEHDAWIAELKEMIGNGSRGDMVDNDPQHTIQTAPTLDSDGKSAFPLRAMQSFGNSEQLNQAPVKQPASNEPESETYKLPSQASNEVNDGAWKLHDMLTEHGPLNGHQFNNLKGCFYEALKVAMRNSPATPDGWIPVSERMPDKLIPVIVMYEDGEMWSAMWNGNRWDDGTEYPDPHSVTHWCEMPAAPQQE